ncbi:MAG: glucose-1-phosphate cytidylyltransferase [Clostridia bacterium]|nr:glucose-1-phosphate cytidylyltransferase [Oscillospiraceae bacterium]MBQ2773627.1 glucose-1-phosphate cytidylyltransferase [Clostridia bacterium]
MKVVILAGGFGTRISEESHLRPKPMVEIGGMPLLWHIMKYYATFGYCDFIICAGYKQDVIKDFFANYYLNHSDVSFDFSENRSMTVHNTASDPWRVTVVDTGRDTMTGGRLKRVRQYLDAGPFFLTYGDGLCDVDLRAEVAFHRAHGCLATLLAVRPDSRFGVLQLDGDAVRAFREKSASDAGLINGGFMVLDPRVLDYIEGDATVFERAPLERLCAAGQLMAFRHEGFWQCMDTLRDKEHLEHLWQQGRAPWQRWRS